MRALFNDGRKHSGVRFLTTGLLFTLLTLFCRPNFAVTLSGEIDLLITNHPLLTSQKALIDASNDRINEARSGFLPRIDLSGGTSKEYLNPVSGSSSQLTSKELSRSTGLCSVSVLAGLAPRCLCRARAIPSEQPVRRSAESSTRLAHSFLQPVRSNSGGNTNRLTQRGR